MNRYGRKGISLSNVLEVYPPILSVDRVRSRRHDVTTLNHALQLQVESQRHSIRAHLQVAKATVAVVAECHVLVLAVEADAVADLRADNFGAVSQSDGDVAVDDDPVAFLLQRHQYVGDVVCGRKQGLVVV